MNENNDQFVDIMVPRRAENSVFTFMTRAWRPQKTFYLDKTYSPQDLKDVTEKSVFMDAIIEAESARTGISKEMLRNEVLKYLEEMGLDKKMYVIRWMGVVFLKISFMMKIGVFVNEPAILSFKSSMGKNPVLFLPTHRSYADFCLMTYLCYHYDIDLPAVAAGMDFYSMAVVGRSMRDTCAFYIRRTLSGAPLYAATLRQYVRTLVARHGAPLEFFIEGTRSRSNKSLAPKYGMLAMALAPLFAGEVSDVTIVPINISYDRLMEHGLFAYEHLGVPKPKESTGGFLKAVFRLNDHFGNIYINMGAPLQVRQYLSEELTPDEELLKPAQLQQPSAAQLAVVRRVAGDVIAAHQACTVVTITNLIALVLMQSLLDNKPLLYEEVLKEIEWLIAMLRRLGARVFENNIKTSVDKILVVHREMLKLDEGKLKLISSAPMNITAEIKAKMKGHTLEAETMVNAVPIIQLQLYVNPVLHYLVPPALVAALAARGPPPREQLTKDFHLIRKLLKYEFFFVESSEDDTLEKSIAYCVENDVVCLEASSYMLGGNVRLRSLLRAAAAPALAALLAAADAMSEVKRCYHASALKLIQARAEAARRHPYCLSLEAAGACLRGLLLAGALRQALENDKQVYTVTSSMEECRALVASLAPPGRVQLALLRPRAPARL